MDKQTENTAVVETPASPKPRIKITRIAAFQPPRLPVRDDSGKVGYEMQVVTMMNRLQILSCTQKCWQKHKDLRPDMNKKTEFHLSSDQAAGVVVDFSPAAAPNMSGFQEAGPDGTPVAQRLVIHQWPDGTFTPESVPDRFTTPMVEAVLAELDKVGTATRGTSLGGRFFVSDTRNQPDGMFISVEFSAQ